ncbi:MAG: YncE family protein [Acidobacteriota bacterium]
MALQQIGSINLPPHVHQGGFDHAAVHRATGRIYVAHTANDALDLIDGTTDRYLHSIPNLTGVAGALVSDEADLVFTSNRGENTVGIFSPGDEKNLVKIPVGVRPNGLAYDPERNVLLAANVGDPAMPNSFTLSIVDVAIQKMAASIPVPGRTRWTVYDPDADIFFVNIADPPQIVVVDAKNPTRVERAFPIPVAGPHGLDLQAAQHRLFCACDGKRLVVVDNRSGQVLQDVEIGGVPDVIFFNDTLQHLYIAIGDPGVIEVFNTGTMHLTERVQTEKGAHTLAFDPMHNEIYAFLPQSHRAAVYSDVTE